MATVDRDEVEQAFRTYWRLGAVGEDWDAWVDECFTDDVEYIEHVLGNMRGREAVRAWIKPIMADYGELYTVYEWHQVGDDGRVVVYMQNRRDNPDPAGPPIDFPGITVLQYGSNGQFSSEEDFWAFPAAQKTLTEYAAALERHDPDHKAKRTRRDWGSGPEWTQGAPTWADSLGAQRAQT
jgi:SnoaL-like domain